MAKAKKTPAKKTPAKKAPAKKSPAKKAPAKKPAAVPKAAAPAADKGVSLPTVPPVPPGFQPPKERIVAIATAQQERDALDVAREITTSRTYEQDFTHRAPPAPQLAAELAVAKAWSDQTASASAWYDYVRIQRDMAWKQALDTARKLKPEFDLAVKHDPAVTQRYPQTSAFLGVWKAAASRASATKAAKKKAARKDEK